MYNTHIYSNVRIYFSFSFACILISTYISGDQNISFDIFIYINYSYMFMFALIYLFLIISFHNYRYLYISVEGCSEASGLVKTALILSYVWEPSGSVGVCCFLCHLFGNYSPGYGGALWQSWGCVM